MELGLGRPYVICLTSSSLDGATVGPYYHEPRALKPKEIFFRISNGYQCRMSIMGAVSAAKFWTAGYLKKMPEVSAHYEREDYLAPTDADYFFAIIDAEGTLAYKENVISKSDSLFDKNAMRRYHPVEVLTEKVSDAYLEYLREHGISYLFAGKNEFDARLCIEKLGKRFNVDRILDLSGGLGNYTLLKAGVIDELVQIVFPYTDGARGVVKVFDRFPDDESELTIYDFDLIDVMMLDADCVQLRYRPKNAAK